MIRDTCDACELLVKVGRDSSAESRKQGTKERIFGIRSRNHHILPKYANFSKNQGLTGNSAVFFLIHLQANIYAYQQGEGRKRAGNIRTLSRLTRRFLPSPGLGEFAAPSSHTFLQCCEIAPRKFGLTLSLRQCLRSSICRTQMKGAEDNDRR